MLRVEILKIQAGLQLKMSLRHCFTIAAYLVWFGAQALGQRQEQQAILIRLGLSLCIVVNFGIRHELILLVYSVLNVSVEN